MANKNVIYVDPDLSMFDNYLSDINDGKKDNMYNFSPDLENYCIAIDLEVEIKERGGGSASKKILLNWSCDKGDKSFLSGRNMNFNGGKPNNVLTTDPTEFGTYSDILKSGTNECFGINSINIMYNNYMVPEVTIEFTDIRGVSLFAPEELRHRKITYYNEDDEVGISGSVDRNVAGSFFKCFFTFPYPVFRLMVKGFYGEPTTYELSCSDFRARFDCNTGNFGATAKFIGYSYSLLNDITMNALCVAPYCKYGGEKFWLKRLENKDYILNDGTFIHTFAQIINKSNNLKRDLAKSKITLISDEKMHDANQQIELLGELLDTYENYYNSVTSDIEKLYKDNVFYLGKSFVIVIDGINNAYKYNFEDNNQAKESYYKFKKQIEEYKSIYNSGAYSFEIIPLIIDDDAYTNEKIEKALNFIKSNTSFNNRISEFIEKNFENNSCLLYLFDGQKLSDELIEAKNKADLLVQKYNEKLKEQSRNISLDNLGFVPSVYNITKTLMAHFETLMHCIYMCANEIFSNKDARRPDKLGISTNGSDIIINDFVPPFPKVKIEKIENGVKVVEEGWIGELNNGEGMNTPEAKLIDGLLEATKQCSTLINSAIINLDESNSFPTVMTVPLSIMDILIDKHPFGDDLVDSDFADFVGRLILRAFSVSISTHKDYSKEDDAAVSFETFGKLDGVNFVSKYPYMSETFKSQLCNVDNIVESILNTALGNDETKKINGSWPWEIDSNEDKNDKNGIIVDFKDDDVDCYRLSLYKKNNSWFLPIQGISWGKIKNDLSKNLDGICGGSNCDYISSSSLSDNIINDKIFKIDDLGYNYSSAINLMTRDGLEVPFAKEYDIEFNQKSLASNYNIEARYDLGYALENSKDWKPAFMIESKGKFILPRKRTDINSPINKGRGKCDVDIAFGEDSIAFLPPPHFEEIKLQDDSDKNYYSVKTEVSSGATIDNLTYRMFLLGNDDGTGEFPLFGCYEYYAFNEDTRELLFLESLHYKKINIQNVINYLSAESPLMLDIPYASVVLLGGYLYNFYQKGNNWKNKLRTLKGGRIGNLIKCGDNSVYNGLVNGCNFYPLVNNLRKEIKTALIEEFKKWRREEWPKIKEWYEIKLSDITKEFTDRSLLEVTIPNGHTFDTPENKEKILGDKAPQVCRYIYYLTLLLKEVSIEGKYNANHKEINRVISMFDDNFFESYMGITYYKYSVDPEDDGSKEHMCLSLLNRENSYRTKYIMEFFQKYTCAIKVTNSIKSYENGFTIKKSRLTKYISGFIDSIKENSLEKNLNTTSIDRANSDYNIRVTLYKYLKNLWDRWLSGTKEEFWYLESFFDNKWFFIDSFYNKIGDLCMVDVLSFSKNIVYSQTTGEYSLLSFISKAYAESKFSFHCVQNFMDLATNDSNSERRMMNMFKPLPFNKIDYSSIDNHPSFVLLYPNEYSSKLNFEESLTDTKYVGDSFDISVDDENLPLPIRTKDLRSGYRIPAFGVTYGKQYQNFFKNIDVSMDTPMITEQSLQAQFMIASPQKDNENGSDIITLGQDLYTIYSNNSYTCTVTMMGCAWIQPLMYFQLNNIPLFRGAYLIQKVSHKITPGNMETTFVGVRMANTSTKKCNIWYFATNENELGDGSSRTYLTKEDREAKIASPLNDCPYKKYNPNEIISDNGFSDEVLNMTLKQYEQSVGHTFDDFITNTHGDLMNTITIAKLLLGTVYKESGNQDDLGRLLVATALFNRAACKGYDLTKVYKKDQHECMGYTDLSGPDGGYSGTDGGKNKRGLNYPRDVWPKNAPTPTDRYKKVLELFKNTPSILIGKQTSVTNPIPLYNDGVYLDTLTSSKTLDENDVTSLDSYCTQDGYDTRISVEEKKRTKLETKDYWRNGKYICHHKGHVFVQSYTNSRDQYWKVEEVTSNKDDNENRKFTKNLFKCIQESFNFTDEFKNAELHMTIIDDNTMDITSNGQKDLETVFDIMLSTYYEYISKVYYGSEENNQSSYANMIRVITSKTNYRKTISYVYVSKKQGGYEILADKSVNIKLIPESFYNVCRKKINSFNTISDDEIISIFNNFTVDDLNNIRNEKVTPCIDFQGKINDSDFSWTGSSLSCDPNNANQPSSVDKKKFDEIKKNNEIGNFIGGMVIAIKRLNGKSYNKQCAKTVRMAINSGLTACKKSNIVSNPVSACIYEKFLSYWGFSLVYEAVYPTMRGYNPENGDIAVVAGKLYGEGENEKYKHGHIHIYVQEDNSWHSYVTYDYKKVAPYSGEHRPFKIFRLI